MDRDRQARREAERARGSSKRGALALFSREEAAQRKRQRGKAEIAPRFAATATQELNCKRMAMLCGAEAAEVMMSKPQPLPALVLEGPHEASPASHEDWTIEDGNNNDPANTTTTPRSGIWSSGFGAREAGSFGSTSLKAAPSSTSPRGAARGRSAV